MRFRIRAHHALCLLASLASPLASATCREDGLKLMVSAHTEWPPKNIRTFLHSISNGHIEPIPTRLIPPREIQLTETELNAVNHGRPPFVRIAPDQGPSAVLEAARMRRMVQSHLTTSIEGSKHIEIIPIQKVGVNRYRYRIKTTIERPNDIVELHDTLIMPGDRAGMYRFLSENPEAASNGVQIPEIEFTAAEESAGEPLTESQIKTRLDAGKATQIRDLHERLADVYSDYIQRRKWDRHTIEELYQHTLSTLDGTRSIVIRERAASGGLGKMVGTFSVHHVSYGKIHFFNAETEKWMEVIGSVDSGLDHEFPEIYGDYRAVDSYVNSHRAVPILSMEDIKGHEFTLDRPGHITNFIMPGQGPNTLPIGTGMTADLNKGVFFYGGRIDEPTKLWNLKNHPAREEHLRTLWKFIADYEFPGRHLKPLKMGEYSFNFDFFGEGRRVYTYNPTKEWPILLGRKGFKQVESIPRFEMSGRTWDVVSLSPAEVELSQWNGKGMLSSMIDSLMSTFFKDTVP